MELSVIIPTHNPDPSRLGRTIAGLRAQTAPVADWELCLVDNASHDRTALTRLDLGWHPAAKVVYEPRLGLSTARSCGIRGTSAPVVVFVDDDNVLAPDYLRRVMAAFDAWPHVGALGGRSIPEFEGALHPWHAEFIGMLAIRDLGSTARVSKAQRPVREYPAYAPMGAGMAARRIALQAWLNQTSSVTDRRGGELTSGGDNDMVLRILNAGWQVAYVPELTLTHLIPTERLEPAYLARLNRAMQKSWMQVLSLHGINAWPTITATSAALRKLKAWFTYRGWQRPTGYIRWQGACGHFDGRISRRIATES